MSEQAKPGSRPGFRVLPFPAERRIIADAGRFWRHTSIVYGLLECDITDARSRIREHKERTGESLSLTAYVIACLSRAVAADRSVHAYRDWRNRLIIYDDVDISVIVEVKSGDRTFPMLHVIRAADRKTFQDISDEIRSVQSGRHRTVGLGGNRAVKLLVRMPRFVRDCVYWVYLHVPRLWKNQGGTVGVTSLGMFTNGGGWGIPITNYNLSICIGGIVERPAFVGDRVERREFLDVTVALNHDVIDGGPAARFVRIFRELVEDCSLFSAQAGPARVPSA